MEAICQHYDSDSAEDSAVGDYKRANLIPSNATDALANKRKRKAEAPASEVTRIAAEKGNQGVTRHAHDVVHQIPHCIGCLYSAMLCVMSDGSHASAGCQQPTSCLQLSRAVEVS